MRARQDDGVATMWGVVLIGVLVTVTLLCAHGVSLVVAQRQAQLGADLSALAGADSLQSGGDGCSAAKDVASRNHTKVLKCTAEGTKVRVVVGVPKTVLGLERVARGRALAGPGEVHEE